MSKIDKSIDKWLTDTPTDCPVDRVMAVLKRYFGGKFDQKSGSHIIIRDNRLAELEGYSALGHITIPVKNGQTVKGVYLKKLALAVNLVRSLEDEEAAKPN